MILELDFSVTAKRCERCQGTKWMRVAFPRFWIHLQEISLRMPPGKERFCTLFREYRRWQSEGTIPCSEC